MNEHNKHIDFELLTSYLAGELSAAKMQEVDDWIASSEDNRKEFEELAGLWKLTGNTQADSAIDIDAEWVYHQTLLSKEKTGRSSQFQLGLLVRIAAVILVVFGLAVLGVRYFTTDTVSTQYAETLQTVLPDGSKVTLNSGSEIRMDRKFNEQDRKVFLEGEAYFEITRDTTKPFLISAGETQIRVLGTAFNVKAYKHNDKIEVTVTEGVVSISQKNQATKKLVAKKGEKVEFARNSEALQKQSTINPNFLSWKTRKLTFEDNTLQEVVNTLEEVYYVDIELKNPAIGSCTLNAEFDEKDLATVLRVIESTLDISSAKEKGIIYLDGSGCQ